eukprot:GEMP01026138.1.p1 GENE.GEMP01026138.1~~GEMP01026138.1.p1  ORF type:complete len:202 (+),score=20.22 GEMP01026138.1:306-911(+)
MQVVGYVYMAILSVQFGTQPLIMRKLVSPEVLTSVMVLVTELSKASIAGVILFFERPLDLKKWTVQSCIIKAGLPALSYAVQNQCNYAALRNLDSVTYSVLNQTKIIATAVCVYLLMGIRPTIRQLFGMSFLMVAVALVISVDEATSTTGNHEFGLFSGVVASILSGIGAALTQRTLQKDKRHSVLYSGELGLISGLIVSL